MGQAARTAATMQGPLELEEFKVWYSSAACDRCSTYDLGYQMPLAIFTEAKQSS